MSQEQTKLSQAILAALPELVRRIGAESAAIVHPKGRVILRSGSSLPDTLEALHVDFTSPLVLSLHPNLGALYSTSLFLGVQRVLLVVRCTSPRGPEFQQAILNTAAQLQSFLEAFGQRSTLNVDDWFAPQ